jgi:hypothetical protein
MYDAEWVAGVLWMSKRKCIALSRNRTFIPLSPRATEGKWTKIKRIKIL